MRSMLKVASVVLALGFGAAAVVADAQADASPFAGSYAGTIPGTNTLFNPIVIASNGSVKSSYELGFGGVTFAGSMAGRVSDAGALSVRGWTAGGTAPTPGGGGGNGKSVDKRYFAVDAVVALDSAGNVVGTTTDGTPFTLTRN